MFIRIDRHFQRMVNIFIYIKLYLLFAFHHNFGLIIPTNLFNHALERAELLTKLQWFAYNVFVNTPGCMVNELD